MSGRCTVVNDEICISLRKAYEVGQRNAKEQLSHIQLVEFDENYGGNLSVEKVAVFNDRHTTEENVDIFLGTGETYNPEILIATKTQWCNIFGRSSQ